MNDRLPRTCPHLQTNPRQVTDGTQTCVVKIGEVFTEYGTVMGGILLGSGSIMVREIIIQ